MSDGTGAGAMSMRSRLAGGAIAGVGLGAAAAAITLSGYSGSDPGLAATARALMVAVPIGVGLYAWQRRPADRFGPLLMLAGLGWFLTTLAESSDSIPYSVGRVAGWFVEIGLIYLILSFPTGRLTNQVDRVLVGCGVALVALLYLPLLPVVEDFPVPSPYTSCTSGCPDNAFFVLGSEPGFVDSVAQPLRELLSVLLFGAVTLRVAERVTKGTPLMRLTSAPVLGVASVRLAVLAVATIARAADVETSVVAGLSWTIALALPLMALAFLVGLLRWRFHVAGSLEHLGSRLRASRSPGELRAVLAETVSDPSLDVIYRAGDGAGEWVDSDGLPATLPQNGSGLSVTEVRNGQRWVAAIVHDESLQDQREYIEAVASYALVALENERLVEASLRGVRESRARILAASDAERRRIERDLHDGAQQHLVALRIQLELTEDLLRRDSTRGLEKLHQLGDEVDETLELIRSLAHGVYPSLLADRGLGEALRAAALSSPLPATLEITDGGRYGPVIETAVYFCCLEALQNAAKHATGATKITIRLTGGVMLRFEVADDGAGFDTSASSAGVGLTNMRDRTAAVGGEVTITSVPGRGTRVAGAVPIPQASMT